MKAVFVGGGSLRLLGILRGALGEPGIFEGGEINLYDLDVRRASAMGRMILKTPEYARVRCKVTWGTTLASALEGADMVGVILMAGSTRTFNAGAECCYRHGFIPSDNVSPNGAFLAIKGAPILMDLARQMRRYCPNAWLVDFANPIAVLSAMVNNHTPIKTMGVCGGFINHQWDISRLLGKDQQGTFDVDTVGVNHLSFIVRGSVDGQDLFDVLKRRLRKGWKPPRLAKTWSKAYQKAIPRGLKALARFFNELGLLIFSSEGDGMMHLHYDEVLKERLKEFKPSTPTQFKKSLEATKKSRQEADRDFQSYLGRDLEPRFWEEGWRQPGLGWAQRQDRDIFVEVLRGLTGVRPVKIATSRPNQGAVIGFSDRTVLEYSQILEKGELRAAGRYAVPAVAQGLTASLASHQTMIGDALATDDPKLMAHALLSYPVRPFSRAARELYKELAKINHAEMPPAMRRFGEYL